MRAHLPGKTPFRLIVYAPIFGLAKAPDHRAALGERLRRRDESVCQIEQHDSAKRDEQRGQTKVEA